MRSWVSSSIPTVMNSRQPGAGVVEHAEGAVAGVDQTDGGFDDAAQHARRVEVGAQDQHGVEQLVAGSEDPPTSDMRRDPTGHRAGSGPRTGQTATVTIRVFLLDDHEIVRRGLRELLEAEDDIEVVGEAGTAEEAYGRIPATTPDVAVLDVRLPDGDGIEVCREIRSKHPEIACLMLTSFADDEALFSAIMAGAAGYVLKQMRGTDLVDGVRRVGRGRVAARPVAHHPGPRAAAPARPNPTRSPGSPTRSAGSSTSSPRA